ncbi:MBL fold metallo-hydrolase [Thiohalophilus thiocyanatoxydans]|uniref:Hydroxyacylglutathione hydrolase n=1 Tax=Thiohalophilus thiocyanatoxydans TaxID=381308 RepID=A0A4V3H3X9_9GAMM|nr:MBL fold metallo-hydrolase [Thiohalophilus thiocyanatoxydans]TDY00955.1 hydroxyacylglutathione hydrolase [Thiohalophilus thiocyanatoxydans]
MFLEKIKSPGLAHLSYVIGAGGQAAVIDPRRDIEVYEEIAAANNARISCIFETHRNEDLVSGAGLLAERTGATVYHGPNAAGEVRYAETARDGQEVQLGDLRLKVLETPGHTDDSISIAVYDNASGKEAVAVFTGDALFIGDVGRTDFYPERAEEVAGLLYDSLQRILALGDQAIMLPAHGAGSVCGSGMADREFSTLGHERLNNPRLQITGRDEFIKVKVAEHHYQPPYFRLMEALNLSGTDPMDPNPAALGVEDIKSLGEQVLRVDVRSAEAYASAHLPDSLCVPEEMIPAFAGWLIKPEQRLVLIAENAEHAWQAARHLGRIGFDRVEGYLAGIMDWVTAGEPFASVDFVDTATVEQRLNKPSVDWQLLDVRGLEEVETQRMPEAIHVYVGELPDKLKELDSNKAWTVMCGSGQRAAIAASVLERGGYNNVDVYLGSMTAWQQQKHAA